MAELSFPWLTLLVAVPAVAAALVRATADPVRARRLALASLAITLVLASGAAMATLGRGPVADPWLGAVGGLPLLGVDELSALLLPFAALLFAVVALVAPRTRLGSREEARTLAAQAVVLATYCARDPLVLAALWALSVAPPLLALRARSRTGATRVFAIYMAVAVAAFTAGAALLEGADGGTRAAAGAALVSVAVLIRKGILPVHSWLPLLMERAPMSLATLFSVPQLGAYAFVRLVVPSGSPELLSIVATLSLVTAVYGALLGLVQVEARRAFGFLFLSESALVLAGLEGASRVALTGALVVWIACGLALTGFGMTLRLLEARRGELSLRRFHGGYQRTPLLAASFLVLGLASAGFPGTLGFVGAELLIDGAVSAHPHVGFALVLASALNGITVVRMYGVLFSGARDRTPASMVLRRRELLGLLVLVALLLAAGLTPRPIVRSRARAAADALAERAVIFRANSTEAPLDPGQVAP